MNVLVGLNGELAQPALKFDIEFPNVSSTLKSELEYKLKTEEQKQNQSIFLLATGNFVNDNYGGSNAFAGTLADISSAIGEYPILAAEAAVRIAVLCEEKGAGHLAEGARGDALTHADAVAYAAVALATTDPDVGAIAWVIFAVKVMLTPKGSEPAVFNEPAGDPAIAGLS